MEVMAYPSHLYHSKQADSQGQLYGSVSGATTQGAKLSRELIFYFYF